MNIKILGSGCANCVNLEKVAKQAAAELGIDATFEKVTDFADIASYNIMRTPGLVVDEQVGATEMITLFNIHGAMVYVDADGKQTGYEDVFSKIEMCRAHYAENGLGAEYLDQFIL